MTTPANFAALDLGSNSFHLLIANFDSGRLRVIDRHKDMVRMASGLDSKGRLDAAAIERGLSSLSKMAERIRHLPPERVRVVGTNTLRAAKNAKDFIAPAEKLLGVPIDIIAGTEEARLIYLGVATDFTPGNKRRLIIDIGGGSTELVIGRNRAKLLESLHMGCVSFSRRYFPKGAITAKGFKKAYRAAAAELEPIVEDFQQMGWDEAVGASGTIRSIQRILAELGLSPDQRITPEGLNALKEKILEADTADKLKLPALSDERKPVLPAGLAVLSAVVSELDIKSLQVSGNAVREGIVHDLAGRLAHRDMREATIRYITRQYHLDTGQGRRVSALARRWLPAVAEHLRTPSSQANRLLEWAGRLHEIGLAISHSGYHKHSAYILKYADLRGFSLEEQRELSFLVLNHRRKLREDPDMTSTPDWLLAALFRLACLFHRRRQDASLPPEVRLRAERADKLVLEIPRLWLELHPLTQESLEAEVLLLAQKDIRLKLVVND